MSYISSLPVKTTVCYSCRQADHITCLQGWKTIQGRRVVCVCKCQFTNPKDYATFQAKQKGGGK